MITRLIAALFLLVCSAAPAQTLNPDLDGDYVVSVNDFAIFQGWYAANDPRADLNHNGINDPADLALYQADVAAFDNGWLPLPPLRPGCRVAYLDPRDGDDANDGTILHPVQTIGRAGALAPAGAGNRWAIRRGRTLPMTSMSNWAFQGASAAEPFVIMAYGPLEDARPIIPVPAGQSGIVVNSPSGQPYGWFRIQDIEFSGAGGGYGVNFGNACHDMQLENCYVHGFGINVYLGPQVHGDPRASALTVHRVISTLSWAPGGGDSHGYMATAVDGLLFEECIADQCGLMNSPDRSHGWYGTYGYYMGDPVSLCTGVVYRNCAATRNQCTGIGARGGGTLDGILSYSNAIAVGFGHAQNLTGTTNYGVNTGTLQRFVFEQAHDLANLQPNGIGLDASWTQQFAIRNGVIHHAGARSTGARYPLFFEYFDAGVSLTNVFAVDWVDSGHPDPVKWNSSVPCPIPAGAVRTVAPFAATTINDYAVARGFNTADAWIDSMPGWDRKGWPGIKGAINSVLASYGLSTASTP